MQASVYPRETWMPLRHESNRIYGFIEKHDAEVQLAKLKRVQPHAVLRIAGV